MSKMIQVRNVPDAIHKRLKIRAAQEGVSLSDYILAELRKLAERPSREEILQRLATGQRRDLKPSPTELLRAERDAR